MTEEKLTYRVLPTLRTFHEDPAQYRCIVGPVGSGKTTAASLEVCYYLPWHLFKTFGITRTRWAVVRNTYSELIDTTFKTIQEWFPDGKHMKQRNIFMIKYPHGIQVELMLRACDRKEDIKKFKSLEITGYWIDESIEVPDDVKRMLKNRVGRYPRKCPAKYGIETTNPPDIEHSTYSEFNWQTPVPGPPPEGTPKNSHHGFWQPPRENDENLRPGYYDDLINDYAGDKDWIDMYVQGKPGVLVQGKLVYNNFAKGTHVADDSLIWSKGTLYRGWDNSGNIPAAVVCQIPGPMKCHVMKEFHGDKMNIQDFTRWVQFECERNWPGAQYVDYADPAGENEYSDKGGGFTSNAKLMRDCGVMVKPSEQNLLARINSVDGALGRIDGVLIDPGCTRLINGFMGGYCYEEIGRTGVYSDKPTKNRFSHVHDALQYVFVKLYGGAPKVGIFRPRRRREPRVLRGVRRAGR